MGCDIHLVVERRKVGDATSKWIGILSSDACIGRRPGIAQRDYRFFVEAAAVWGASPTSIYPRNVPENISDLAWSQYMRHPTDYHSASHMTSAEFVAAYRRVNPLKDESRAPYDEYDLLGIDDEDGRFEHRVVFWFDN